MPTINVFVSYVDSFVGKHVLNQFQQFPSTYHVYGCTWDSAAAEKLNAAAAVRTATADANGVLHGNAVNAGATATGAIGAVITSAAAPASVSMDEASRSLLHDSHGTLSPCETSHAETAPLPEDYVLGTIHNNDNATNDGSSGVGVGVASLSEQFPSTSSGAASAAVPAASNPPTALSASFFSRHDIAATRAALLACDWIVLEQRQAQTVLEVVQFLQLQSSFARPKRLVLLSSLMTWYATPSLTADETGATSENGEDADGNVEDDMAAAGEEDGEGADGDVEAPYPPVPPQSLERMLHAAQEAARRAVVDAMRGSDGGSDDSDFTGTANANGSGDEDDNGAAASVGTAAGAGVSREVLTEDQFNRRVPHLQYMSWRDAEKAVAAAHHAKGLPLDTFVVCSGLPYGGEEDVLGPLFQLAWSAQPVKKDMVNLETVSITTTDAAAAAANPAATAVLPVFGDGKQCVPLVHAQDLACFVRKLLRCPTASLPFPERRYLFATDGANSNTWMSIVNGVNRMFGSRCELQTVPPSSYPLYRDVDKFTMNLRVEAESMKVLMERQGDVEEEEEEGENAKVTKGWAQTRLPNTWIAEGGLHRHLRSVAYEFAVARGVDPLRIVLVGPPLVGKSYLAARLARYYRLPCVSIDSVVAEYRAALQALKARMETTKAAVLQAERARRLGIKRRRVLSRQLREWDTGAEASSEGGGRAGASNNGGGVGGRHGNVADEAADDASSNAGSAQGNDGAGSLQQQQQTQEQQHEVAVSAFDLTPAEEDDVTRFVQDWWAEQPQVQAWASKVAEMERVLLLRLHPRPPTPDANPKRRAAGGNSSGKKKANVGKDGQKSKEDEEELQQLKASLQNAPFQPRALTLMLRWRLAQPDCRVQGFVLDGVPATLELARMVFNEDSEENSVQPPATEEEALRPRYVGEGGVTGGGGAESEGGGNSNKNNGGGGNGEREDGVAGPAVTKEVANDARLPDHVVVLQASDTFLLSRLRAMGVAAEQQHLKAKSNPGATIAGESSAPPPVAVDVEAFQQSLHIYKREYEEATYSVLNYWECAAATSTVHGTPTTERRAEVHLISVEGHEPLVPAPPPASAFADIPIGDTEQLLRQVIVGPPHNFGKSLEEVQRDAVRLRCLEEEESRVRAEQMAAQAAAESAECAEEQSTRAAEDEKLAELKRADLTELEARKQPMTRYLQERVLPLLHKGLLEVCATRPEDPVDFLAEWLIRHNPHDDTFCDI